MTGIELDEILTLRWPGVVRRVMADVTTSDFVRSFVLSINRQGKQASWHPSDKQERVMRQMLTDYSGNREPEPTLIED